MDRLQCIGKTALAVHAAHLLAPRYPDGQLFIDLHGFSPGIDPVDGASALDRLLRALGVPGERVPRHPDDRAALLRSLLAGKRMLLLLDNAATEEQVRPLLPGAPGCLALVTSRRRLPGLDHALPLSLDVLPLPDAVALFTRTAGGGLLVESGAAKQVAELCGRLPLALRIAAGRLRARPAWTLAHLVDRLLDRRQPLAELKAGQRSVAATLRLSYDQLPAGQRRLFRLLGLHPGPDIDALAAAALAGCDPLDAARLLEGLVDDHMLQQHTPGRYRFHDLVRQFARGLAEEEPHPGDPEAVRRLLDYWLHAANLAADQLQPGRCRAGPDPADAPAHTPALDGHERAVAWLEAERPNLLAAVVQAAERGLHAHAWQLPHALARFFILRCYHDDWTSALERGLAAARRLGDRRGEAETLTGLGGAAWRAGRNAEALDHLQRALTLFQQAGDGQGEAAALNTLGLVHERQGAYAEALARHERALAIRRRDGDTHGEAMTLGNLGVIAYRQGRHAEALDYHRRALPLFRRTGDRQGEARTLDNVGVDYRRLGRYAEALDHHRQALAVYREIGDRYGEAMALSNLGVAHDRLGRYEDALDHHHRALGLSRRLGDPNLDSGVRNDLGATLRATRRHGAAIRQHRQALATALSTGDRYEQARAHDGIADAFHAQGRHDLAHHHWHQALALYTGLDAPEALEVEARIGRLAGTAADDRRAGTASG